MKYKTIFPAALLLAALPMLQVPAFAQGADPAYFMEKSRSVSVVETTSLKETLLERPAPSLGMEKQVVTAAAIINAGLSAWKVFSGGAPSGGASSAYASAIPPAFYNNWSSVAKWKGPKEYIYDYKVTNRMGVDVIKVKYKISFYYGGTEPASGKPGDRGLDGGAYIANFTVQPMAIDVKWGWHFNMDVGMSNPMNIGTVLKPVAMMEADLNWRVSTMLNSSGDVGIWSYSIDGNGNFADLNAKNEALTKAIPPPAVYDLAPSIAWN